MNTLASVTTRIGVRVELLEVDGDFLIRTDNGRDALSIIDMGNAEGVAKRVFKAELEHQRRIAEEAA